MSPQRTVLSGTIVHEVPPPRGGAPTYQPLDRIRVTAYGAGAEGRRGPVLASVRTGADGRFAFHALREPVTLEIVPPSPPGLWQPGWFYPEYASTDPQVPSWAQFYRNPPLTATVPPDAALGRIGLMPATAEGKVVCEGLPVPGAVVKYQPPANQAPGERGRTDAHGHYRLQDLSYDEYLVRVTADGLVGGYVGHDGLVFETTGEATTWAPGTFPETIHLRRRTVAPEEEASPLLGEEPAPAPVG